MCYVTDGASSNSFRPTNKCGCKATSASMSWQPDLACVSGTDAATTLPAVCKASYQDGSEVRVSVGWITSDVCHLSFYEFSNPLQAIPGVGGPYNMEVLCNRRALI